MSKGRSIGWGKKKAKASFVPYEIRIERIKGDVSVSELLDRLGIVAGPRMKNGHPTYHCPFHDDSDPSLEVTSDDRKWTCWPCQLKMRDAIDLVQMLFFPQEQAKRPKEWFGQTLDRIEQLFGIEQTAAGGIRAMAELRAIRNRQVLQSRQNRLSTRISSRSNRFRLALAKVVRRSLGDRRAEKAVIVAALYGHLEHILASGRSATDSEKYNEWRDKTGAWLDSVRRKLG